MPPSEQEISTRVVVILLIPVVLVFGLVGYIIVDSLTVSQPPSGPDAAVVLSDHPDLLNRSASGERIVTGSLKGESALNWSALVVEVIDPRSDAVIASFSTGAWRAHGAGQTIRLQTNGTPPQPGERLAPGETFVLRDVRDDRDASEDLVNPCESYVFRVRHRPSESVLGSYHETYVADDWVPGTSCDDTAG